MQCIKVSRLSLEMTSPKSLSLPPDGQKMSFLQMRSFFRITRYVVSYSIDRWKLTVLEGCSNCHAQKVIEAYLTAR